MAFIYDKVKHGYMPPWEYYPAPAGSYVTGQMLNLTAGKLAPLSAASTNTPDFLCMYTGTITADDVANRTGTSAELVNGDVIAVARVSIDAIYEVDVTTSIVASTPTKGSLVSVSADGLSVAAAAGTFEILDITAPGGAVGTGAVGDHIRGRFKTVAGS